MAEEIEKEIEGKPQIECVPEHSGDGELEVIANNLMVFSSRQEKRYPEDGEIVKILKS